MLKFSRFSGLTSCLWIQTHKTSAACSHVAPLPKKMFNAAHVQPHQDTCINATDATLKHENAETSNRSYTRPAEKTKDTEANMLSRITRKSNMRSTFCWFTESCNSQCLSHFAAPFIVVRAETSITGSCVVFQPLCHRNRWKHSDGERKMNRQDNDKRTCATVVNKSAHHPWPCTKTLQNVMRMATTLRAQT